MVHCKRKQVHACSGLLPDVVGLQRSSLSFRMCSELVSFTALEEIVQMRTMSQGDGVDTLKMNISQQSLNCL